MKRSFTLIELLVTVGILSLLTAFILPSFQLLLAQYQLSSTVTQVSDFLRLTEQKTVTEQKPYGVTLTVGATTINQFLFSPSPAPGVKTVQTTLTLPNNISISSVDFNSTSDIIFSTSGAPAISGSFVLTDTTRGKNRLVEIRPSGAILSNQPEY